MFNHMTTKKFEPTWKEVEGTTPNWRRNMETGKDYNHRHKRMAKLDGSSMCHLRHEVGLTQTYILQCSAHSKPICHDFGSVCLQIGSIAFRKYDKKMLFLYI